MCLVRRIGVVLRVPPVFWELLLDVENEARYQRVVGYESLMVKFTARAAFTSGAGICADARMRSIR